MKYLLFCFRYFGEIDRRPENPVEQELPHSFREMVYLQQEVKSTKKKAKKGKKKVTGTSLKIGWELTILIIFYLPFTGHIQGGKIILSH